MSPTPILLLLLLSLATASRCRKNPSVYNFKLASLRGTIVTDGPISLPTNPFFVPDEAVHRSYATAFRGTTPIIFSQNVLVLDTPEAGRVLVDTGSRGAQSVAFARKAGLLFDNLAAAGIAPESIDAVLLTHAHVDHVSGLRAPDGTAAFPNADVYIGRTEHEFWADPPSKPNSTDLPADSLSLFSIPYLQSIEPYKGRLRLVQDNGRPLPGIRFILGPGHSPGHNAIEFTSDEKRLIVSGDTWITRPDQVQNPEWGFSPETDRLAGYRSRINLLTLAAGRKDLVLSYHEQFPGLGFISQAGHLFDWVPAPAQMLGTGVAAQC